MARSYKSGAVAYLRKPVQVDQLLRAVGDLPDYRRSSPASKAEGRRAGLVATTGDHRPGRRRVSAAGPGCAKQALTAADELSLAEDENTAGRPPGRCLASRETYSATAISNPRGREAAMRGVTLAMIGAAVAVLLAIAMLHARRRRDPRTRAPTSAWRRGPRAGTGPAANSGAMDGDARNPRVAGSAQSIARRLRQAPGARTSPRRREREAPTSVDEEPRRCASAPRRISPSTTATTIRTSSPRRATRCRTIEDPDERIGAILMLTGDEGPESLRMLMEAMDDPDPEVRLAVVEALGDRVEELTPGTARQAAARSRCRGALRGGEHPRRHGGLPRRCRW